LNHIPVVLGDLNLAAVRTQSRGTLPSPPFLHIKKTLAERIGAKIKIFTGEEITIPQAVVNLLKTGAGQDRAGGS
jgi:hypothetical protein